MWRSTTYIGATSRDGRRSKGHAGKCFIGRRRILMVRSTSVVAWVPVGGRRWLADWVRCYTEWAGQIAQLARAHGLHP